MWPRQRRSSLCFDASDPLRLARFWAGVLGWEATDDRLDDGVALLPSDDTGFRLRFFSTQELKVVQNQMHFDLTSTSLEAQEQTVATSLGLGARHTMSGNARRRVTWCLPTPKATSSA